MNREQRKAWLAKVPEEWLCRVCRYVEYVADCYYCTHPLNSVAENSHNIDLHVDCWGFRPRRGEAK